MSLAFTTLSLLVSLLLPAGTAGPERNGIPAAPRILVALDCSGSMREAFEGAPRMEAARAAALALFESAAGGECGAGLLAFGHRDAASCADIEVVVAPGAGSGAAAAARVRTLAPLGKTPLAAAIDKAGEVLLAGGDVPLRLVVITDGVETCGGDPVASARALRSRGVDVKVHVLGLAVDAGGRQALEAIAAAGGGAYHHASDSRTLQESLGAVRAEVVAPAPAPAAPADFHYRSRFESEESFRADFEVLDADADRLAMEQGLLIVTQTGNPGAPKGSLRNLALLRKPLPEGDYDVVVETSARVTGHHQTFGILLYQDSATMLQAGHYGKPWGNNVTRRFFVGKTVRGETVSVEEDLHRFGAAPEDQPIAFRVEKRGMTFTLFACGADGDGSDREWKKIGEQTLIGFRPRLGLFACNTAKSAEIGVHFRETSVRCQARN